MLFNAPNVLTLLRIVLIPAFIAAYYWTHPLSHVFATGLFVLAALTDWLDGYLARRLQQTTHFGTFLDPVADKLMVAAAVIVLAELGRIYGVVALIIVGREITVSALREWMAHIGQAKSVAVNILGKVKTVSQLVAIPFLLYNGELFGLFHTNPVGQVLILLAAGITLWSMVVYLKAAIATPSDMK